MIDLELARRLALDPPRAHGAPPASGVLRASLEDFVVEEQLGFAADGGTAHMLLKVEKRDANTLFVARALARHAGARVDDVGFAGLKDRRAMAVQWFTVPAGRTPVDWSGHRGEGYAVLAAQPHSRKLRRGALKGNRFQLRVTALAGDPAVIASRLALLASRGFPNYFGAQRFGRGGANLDAVAAWLAGGMLPRAREERGFVLSTARALVFNAALAARVEAGHWDTPLPGELVNLDGSGSIFLAASVDETLTGRSVALDVHPTGPLPGRGLTRPVGEAAAFEAAATASYAAVGEALAAAGLEAERRPLRARAADLAWHVDGSVLELGFTLGRGTFATALAREIMSSELVLPGDES